MTATLTIKLGAAGALRQMLDTTMHRLKELASVRRLREERYERVFASPAAYGHCRGVFASFSEALRSAPPSSRLGFDHAEFAGDLGERFATLLPHDYPVLFWLQRLIGDGTRLFDLGGYTGGQYHVYRPYLRYPARFEWTVCEVPAVVEKGRALAKERGYSQLRFTVRPADADGSDVLMSAGALQYIESPTLAQLLAAMKSPPKHLVLNKLPLQDGAPWVTLQNSGPVYVAHHVFNRAQLLSQLEALGYQLVDSWEVPGFSTEIPFRPDRSVPRFTGLYLRAP